jgi:hypothetical protein
VTTDRQIRRATDRPARRAGPDRASRTDPVTDLTIDGQHNLPKLSVCPTGSADNQGSAQFEALAGMPLPWSE